jgi:8-oxo-dGTP pyrophosphatase MutT (NUDIX family)
MKDRTQRLFRIIVEVPSPLIKKPECSITEEEISRRLRLALTSAEQSAELEFPALLQFATGAPKPAAVLIPLLRSDGEWQLLFTRRNAALPEHSGQVSFPGGRSDPGDESPVQTALRETHEEIGLHPNDVRVLGQMRPYRMMTNYLVTPVVGAIPWPYPLRPAQDEVSRIFTIPLSWLAEEANYEEQFRELPQPHDPARVIYYKPYDGEILWGASARMTINLIRLLKS